MGEVRQFPERELATVTPIRPGIDTNQLPAGELASVPEQPSAAMRILKGVSMAFSHLGILGMFHRRYFEPGGALHDHRSETQRHR